MWRVRVKQVRAFSWSSPLEAQSAEDDAGCASWAYFSLLMHENRILGKLDRRPIEGNEHVQDDTGSSDFAGQETVSFPRWSQSRTGQSRQ
jgi:hypothetical protein